MATSFRLGRVLRLRAQLRQLRQHEADALVARVATLEAESEALTDAREELAAVEAEAARRGPLTAETLRLGRTYDETLAERGRETAAAAAETRVALAAKRDELLHEHREERKFLHLEEAHRERVAVEDARAADRLLDELAIRAHERSR
jgi:flagellar export protein FliJ